MKQRIRTIKPEFFLHEDLFDAETQTGLPLRLAFVGMWTCCDKEGRFEWRPRPLKAIVMPYDEVDFSRVLDALASRGFIVKYSSGGKEYGAIPSWHKHQVVNNRETESKLPEPAQVIDVHDKLTRGPRVGDASAECTSGRGREGELEGKGTIERAKALLSSNDDIRTAYDSYNEMADRAGLSKVQKFTPARQSSLKKRLKEVGGLDGWIVALEKVEQSDFLTGKRPGSNGPFCADLDFIIRPSIFTRLMEGSYDNRSASQQHSTRNTGASRATANFRAGFQASAADDRRGDGSGPGCGELPF